MPGLVSVTCLHILVKVGIVQIRFENLSTITIIAVCATLIPKTVLKIIRGQLLPAKMRFENLNFPILFF